MRDNRRNIATAKVIYEGDDVVDLVVAGELGIVANRHVALTKNSLEGLLHLGGLETRVSAKANFGGRLAIHIKPELAGRRGRRRDRDRLLFIHLAAVGQIRNRVSGPTVNGQGKGASRSPTALETQGLRLIHAGGGVANLFRDAPIRGILKVSRLFQPQTRTATCIGQGNRLACQRANKFEGKAIVPGARHKHIAQPNGRNLREGILEAGDQNRVGHGATVAVQGRNRLAHAVVFQRVSTLTDEGATGAGDVQINLGVSGFAALLRRVRRTALGCGGDGQCLDGLREFRLLFDKRKITVQAADPFDR